ncbi:retrovirus-related pol polyprotein from transposon TNT 1-94 [Tanacetum coccineum]
MEYYYADHMNAILGVYTELDEVTNLQCDYLEALEKCERLEKELSKSRAMSKSFEALKKHAINLELALQQYLKAQLQDKGIAISELKKLKEKMKGKSMETKTKQPIVVPISTKEPKRPVNQSVVTPFRRIVATDSTVKKPRSIIRKLYKHGNDLLTGSCGSDLYSITLQDTSTPNLICLMAKATSSQAWLWHRRLSHLNFDTINLLSKYDIVTGLPKLKFVKDHLCSSCELWKAKYDIQAAGSDTRPPMLDRTDYESWSQRIRLYCRGKENGLLILQSIDQGPFELGTTRNTLGTTPEGGVLLGPERPHVRATNIVLQGLPKDIYKLINHNIKAKAIWDNVKMLLAGSELTKEDRESQLYDEFERFKMLPGENINEYYVRFHKLVNDIRNIRMPNGLYTLNSKFVNNMSPEWDRFVTAVKLNKGLKEINHEQLYAYLKQHEKHDAQDRLIIERITPTANDQLAFVSTVQPHVPTLHVQSYQYPSSSATPQSPQFPHFPETSQPDSGHTQTDEILDNLTKQMALLA